ncbi:hypothetical protein H1Z61_04190 [Bacillus aquiflavi]|uniref:DUF6792 domain-containing protein n=1 Tax=Bacillus aquiflavi TaxID=2672567 RepID=A0A6B3VRU9_9BACI|nr:DUF6792 domain-containing protein [Bacillus aquiflavi]MBA4536361.1 hypothetical protein [Bacillus aquiflavi]NEY80729.1 hypothetical protein [Bacillus aquiflavi]
MKTEQNEVLELEEVWLRTLMLEYNSKKMSKEKFEKELRRIHFEETGEDINANITIIRPDELEELRDRQSGYDGTAIFFSNEKENIQQLYIVSQGSQDLVDWLYNLFGIYGGQDGSQYRDTGKFLDESLNEIKNRGLIKSPLEIMTIALAHSLAENNNLNVRLVDGKFDKLYGVNGAQPDFYQLAEIDKDFLSELRRKFKLKHNDNNAIYSLPPEEVKAFAEKYYQHRGENSFQLISLEILFMVPAVKGTSLKV